MNTSEEKVGIVQTSVTEEATRDKKGEAGRCDSHADAMMVGLTLSLLGETERLPSSLVSMVVVALPQPLTRTCRCEDHQ